MIKNYKVEGHIARGFGEGAFFMSIKHYQKEIKIKLGFKAYPGTLNIKVGKKQKDLLKNLKKIKINGFKENERIFGGADCYKAKIKNIDGAIIIPQFTKHKDIIEFIAPIHIKSTFKLKDGDNIHFKIEC